MKGRIAVGLLCVVLIGVGVAASAQPRHREEAPDLEMMKGFIGFVKSYLEVSDRWMEICADRDSVVYMVSERTTELFERRGDKAGAIPRLEALLAKPGVGPVGKNAVRFKIADIHKEAGNHDEALKQLDAIINSLGR